MDQNDYDELDDSRMPCKHSFTYTEIGSIEDYDLNNFITLLCFEICDYCGAQRGIKFKYNLTNEKILGTDNWEVCFNLTMPCSTSSGDEE